MGPWRLGPCFPNRLYQELADLFAVLALVFLSLLVSVQKSYLLEGAWERNLEDSEEVHGREKESLMFYKHSQPQHCHRHSHGVDERM